MKKTYARIKTMVLNFLDTMEERRLEAEAQKNALILNVCDD